MFTLPPPNNDGPEGEVEDNPILLEGFKATDFERFLSILYPLYVTSPKVADRATSLICHSGQAQ